MVVGAKVCELTDDFLWFVCGLYVGILTSPLTRCVLIRPTYCIVSRMFQLSGSLYKKVLVVLHEKVMPFMSNPLLLADFLTSSYNIGQYHIY